LAASLSTVIGGCGAKTEPPPRTEENVASRARDAGAPARAVHISRSDIVAALSAGLGAFLAHLQVEPAMTGGKFNGWRVLALRANDPMWAGVDLAPGDVVSSVNGKPIERPEQALAAFQSLAVAPELRVRYERQGAPRELVYPIDDVPSDGGAR
jgi:type II secretory pathway component PulC